MTTRKAQLKQRPLSMAVTVQRSSWCVGGRTKRQLFHHKLKLMISVLLTLSANSTGIKNKHREIPIRAPFTHTCMRTHTETQYKKNLLLASTVAHTEMWGNADTHTHTHSAHCFIVVSPAVGNNSAEGGHDCFIPGDHKLKQVSIARADDGVAQVWHGEYGPLSELQTESE